MVLLAQPCRIRPFWSFLMPDLTLRLRCCRIRYNLPTGPRSEPSPERLSTGSRKSIAKKQLALINGPFGQDVVF